MRLNEKMKNAWVSINNPRSLEIHSEKALKKLREIGMWVKCTFGISQQKIYNNLIALKSTTIII